MSGQGAVAAAGEARDVPPGLEPGTVVAGKYRIERVLGQGGMGVVVAAHHIQLDERVALKFLLPSALTHVERVARFVREARAAVKIKSEHVARVTDVGTLETGSPYMVMEYLEGVDLERWLETNGAVPVEQAVDFVLQSCEAIAEAHALGIVHRDLKPANLFCIRRSGGQLSIKVLDFGISKLLDPAAPDNDLTRTLTVIGSPQYMPPEQMRGSRDVDVRADIWSLGAILFELVTNQMPFVAGSVTELAIKVASDPPRVLHDLLPTVPAGLEEVIARCLEKSVENRFQDVGQLASALLPFGSRRAEASVERIHDTLRAALNPPTPMSVPVMPRPLLPVQTLATSSWAETGAGPARRSTGRTLGAAVGGIALLLGLVAVTLSLGGTNRAGPSRSATSAAASPAIALSPPLPPVDIAAPPIAPTPVASPPLAAPPAGAAGEPKAPLRAAPTVAAAPRHLAPPPSVAPVTPPSAPSCDPPYTINAKGSRTYKKECL